MPVFEFECNACKHKQEELTKLVDSVVICEQCGEIMQKLMSPPLGFVLKGEGFYKRN